MQTCPSNFRNVLNTFDINFFINQQHRTYMYILKLFTLIQIIYSTVLSCFYCSLKNLPLITYKGNPETKTFLNVNMHISICQPANLQNFNVQYKISHYYRGFPTELAS